MLSHLQLVLLMHFVGVYSQTCYTECLTTSGDATDVNIMVPDGSGYLSTDANRQWVDRKTTEFNRVYPAISVTLKYVNDDSMVTEALQDLEMETNRYHGYVIRGMNVYGGTSVLADRDGSVHVHGRQRERHSVADHRTFLPGALLTV